MRAVLYNPDSSLYPDLVQHYSCEDLSPVFLGIMLSRNGIVQLADGSVHFNICDACEQPLFCSRCRPRLPKFAIANHFFVGALPPALQSATWAELLMTSLTNILAQTRVMRGGWHRSILSHLLVFDLVPGPTATLLPRSITKDTFYRIILAGPFTDGQVARIKKLHRVRHSMVENLLNFYTTFNVLYSDVKHDDEVLDSIPRDDPAFVPTLVIRDLSNDHADAKLLGHEQDGLNAPPGTTTKTTYIEKSVIFSHATAPLDPIVEQRVVELLKAGRANDPVFMLHTSSKFANLFKPTLEAKMFPHLFPYGRGHPGEEGRRVTTLRQLCARHYCLLSSRRFEQDLYYCMAAFDHLPLNRGYMFSHLTCRMQPHLHQYIAGVTTEMLSRGLENTRRRTAGLKTPDTDPAVTDLLRHVECASAYVWGSNAERRARRQEAFATCDRFGQPTIFDTLTPNTDTSFALASYVGLLDVEAFCAVLIDNPYVETEDLKRLSMADNIASARLFDRLMSIFFNKVLGFDRTTQQSVPGGGLFGPVRAYFGTVETQGRGTLHLHCLVWLENTPPTTRDFDNLLEADASLADRVTEYVDNIVFASASQDVSRLPFSIAGVTFHSWFVMHNLKADYCFERRQAQLKGIPGFTPELDLLIIDEFNMTDKDAFLRLDQALRAARKLDIPFGRVHILPTGDFFQLPPVNNTPVYSDPSLDKADTTADHEAFKLWRLFDTVVVLTETVRFRSDPEWGRHCKNARRGIWENDFIDIINSRLLENINPDLRRNFVNPKGGHFPVFVVPDNDNRTQLLHSFTRTLCALLPCDHQPVRIVADFGAKFKNRKPHDIQFIMSLPDNKLRRFAAFLDRLPGMSVLFTQNVDPARGIANRTYGVLYSLWFPEHTTFALFHDTNANIRVLLPSSPPDLALVRVPHRSAFEQLPAALSVALPSDVYPTFRQQPYGFAKVDLPTGAGMPQRTCHVRPLQFPFVSDVASNVYRIQGETLTSLVVVEWKARPNAGHKRKHNVPQQG
ncbi:hypothetical protein CBR_g19772 [Chara braunii]|uniref:ATP-dependent DNA helicase n=1 Tax=Chara braunii TaxID=69332 RepID=A0A388JTY5_CHABU|nr:hypothetical protein CBR_g19772 [Chara braunii]|eukprot:GBG61240.1 hypothetical protein CBR_g19772 [Chara braunii]